MKAFWIQQARRIDALTLRERAIMFVSLATALVGAADALVISPRMAEQSALTTQLRQRTTELDSMRFSLAGAGGAAADTPAARLQRELREAQTQQRAVEAEVALRIADSAHGTRLPELLGRVLRRHERLTLLRLATVPTPVTPPPNGIPLQGVDLSVRGSYGDLTQYVADAEREMPGLRWGEIRLASVGAATELNARVFLIGDVR